MTKINVGRIFEISKILNTKPGRETQEGWEFLSKFSEQVIRALKNGLSFTDNADCKVVDVELPHDTDQIVNTGGKFPVHIVPTRVLSSAETTITMRDFGWRNNVDGDTVVKMAYGNSTETNTVRLLIFFS